jgi:hypothetical protein
LEGKSLNGCVHEVRARLISRFERQIDDLMIGRRCGAGKPGRVNQTAASQQRSEVIDFAVMDEDLVVEIGQELCETEAFFAGDFVKRIPKSHFQPNRRTVTADPKRSGLRFIVSLRLVREYPAHHVSSDFFRSFSKQYTCLPTITMFSA